MIKRGLLWQIPLTVLACIVGSLLAVWVVSRAMGFSMDPSVVAVLSAVISVAVITLELRGKRRA